MDKYAIIEEEIIVNIFIADEDFVAANYSDAIICPDGFGVGDRYSDGKFMRVMNLMPVEEVTQ